MDTSTINILNFVPESKKVAGTNGGEYAAPCPFCGGDDRFRVWPAPRKGNATAWCRGCGFTGDVIALVQRLNNCSFAEALDYLRLQSNSRKPAARKEAPRPDVASGVNDLREDYPALSNPAWQKAAQQFVIQCEDQLWTPESAKALAYLNDRGVAAQILELARVGYNPTDINTTWGGVDVWLPRGIVLPWWIDGTVWRVNIRRAVTGKEKRYIQPAGCAGAGLYMPAMIHSATRVVMVEGEFDALVLLSQGFQFYGFKPCATGSTGGARLLRWITAMSVVRKVLLAFDADAGGDECAAWWSARLPKARRLRPEGAKDITDMWKAGIDLQTWLRSVYVKTQTPQS